MKVKREKSTSTKGHYVRNADLLPAVLEAKEKGEVTTKLIRMIEMIAERYSRKSNFVNYSFREDMVSAAVLNLCNNALKFNPERSATPNPFSFYTTAIHNSFLQYIAEEKKHRQIRDQLLIDAGSNPSFNYQERAITDSDNGGGGSWTPDIELPEESPLEEKAKKLAAAAEGREYKKPAKKVLFKDEHKQPSEGKVFKPSDLVFDEALGYYVVKPVLGKKSLPKKKTVKEA